MLPKPHNTPSAVLPAPRVDGRSAGWTALYLLVCSEGFYNNTKTYEAPFQDRQEPEDKGGWKGMAVWEVEAELASQAELSTCRAVSSSKKRRPRNEQGRRKVSASWVATTGDGSDGSCNESGRSAQPATESVLLLVGLQPGWLMLA